MAQENIGIVVFLFVGIAILGFAIHWFVTLKSKLQKFDLLNCIVVGHEKKKFRSLKPFHINVNYLFSPEVEYHTHADAKPKIHKDPLMLFFPRHKVGEHLEIFVDPEGKEAPILNTILSKYSGIFVVSLIGLSVTWAPISFLFGWKNIISS